MLFAHGDVEQPLPSTVRLLDEMVTDFITDVCFESDRAAEIAGRQKVKLDDVKFAMRKNPSYLGKIEEMTEKKNEIEKTRKMVDMADDKFVKGDLLEKMAVDKRKAIKEEELGQDDDDDDDVADGNTERGKGRKGQKGKKPKLGDTKGPTKR